MLRGSIAYRERAKQLRDFSGLQFGKITPTDIDGLIEYHNKCYVIIETKYVTAEIPFGQMLALQRLCDDLQKAKPTLLIIARHHTEVDKDIDFAKCDIEKYRYRAKWGTVETNVKDLVEKFFKKIEGAT